MYVTEIGWPSKRLKAYTMEPFERSSSLDVTFFPTVAINTVRSHKKQRLYDATAHRHDVCSA